MPYKSKKQMAFMHKKHPEIAKRWDTEAEAKGVDMKHLPSHVKKQKAKNK